MMETKEFMIKSMVCTSCEKIIEKQALSIDGVKSCKVDYVKGNAKVTFDSDKTNLDKIFAKIEDKGYTCSSNTESKPKSNWKFIGIIAGIVAILFGGYLILEKSFGLALPELGANTSLALIFLIGILTGFHCIAMCGGFVVSYTAKGKLDGSGKKSHVKPHLAYGTGKIISYGAIGALFGLFGSFFTFTPGIRGIIGILAGIFLIVFGLNMLDMFPFLRRLKVKSPKILDRFIAKESSKHKSPFIIGLLNGLMIACGPLLAMYIYAAGTGSVLQGALALGVFGLGTLPVMFGFGIVTSLVSSKLTHKILKFSGIVVIILGIILFNQGLTLTGSGYDINTFMTSVSAGSFGDVTGNALAGNAPVLNNGVQEIRMDVTRFGYSPDKFILQKDVPVKWIINGKELTGCNKAIQVPKLGLKFDIKPGIQTIEFTPTQEGVIPWSCWMGMIPGTFIVKDNVDLNNQAAVQKELDNVPQQQGGSCGAATGGGCGCGG